MIDNEMSNVGVCLKSELQSKHSSVKSQLNILLQAIASCCVVSNEVAVAKKCISGSMFKSVIQKNPHFEQILKTIDIFHIYEPLVPLNVGLKYMDYDQRIGGCSRKKGDRDGDHNQERFTIPVQFNLLIAVGVVLSACFMFVNGQIRLCDPLLDVYTDLLNKRWLVVIGALWYPPTLRSLHSPSN